MSPLLLLLILAADVETLAANAGVAKAEQILPGKPAIVHLVNCHWVPKRAFAESEGLEGPELDREYAAAMATAAKVHNSLLHILADVPEVYVEGLTDGNQQQVARELLGLAVFHRELKQFDPDDGEATRQILAEHRQTLLRLGAAAELLLDGKPIKMLPAEGAEHEAGRPRGGMIDDKLQAAREAAIVKRITAKKATATLVLGGAHDLTPAIRPTGWGYIRVTPRGYPTGE